MKEFKNTDGITLVALIITIIILLILAIVTISAVNEGNLFAHANNATTKYSEEAKLENTKVSEWINKMEQYDGRGTINQSSGIIYNKKYIANYTHENFGEHTVKLYFLQNYRNKVIIEIENVNAHIGSKNISNYSYDENTHQITIALFDADERNCILSEDGTIIQNNEYGNFELTDEVYVYKPTILEEPELYTGIYYNEDIDNMILIEDSYFMYENSDDSTPLSQLTILDNKTVIYNDTEFKLLESI